MKPAQVVSKLRQIATAIDNSKNPNPDLVAKDLRNVISSMRIAARILHIKNEEDPKIEGVGAFAYFYDTPTIDEVIQVRNSIPAYSGMDWSSWSDPEEISDKISRQAGFSRWFIGPAI